MSARSVPEPFTDAAYRVPDTLSASETDPDVLKKCIDTDEVCSDDSSRREGILPDTGRWAAKRN